MNKIQVTAQQRANALEARDVMWPSVPEANVSPHLDWWRGHRGLIGNATTPPDCGTIACFGGWCAWWPAFRAQGVTASKTSGAPIFETRLADHHLFGEGGLFVPSAIHEADEGFVGTDHALVLNRLNWLIEHSEVIG